MWVRTGRSFAETWRADARGKLRTCPQSVLQFPSGGDRQECVLPPERSCATVLLFAGALWLWPRSVQVRAFLYV